MACPTPRLTADGALIRPGESPVAVCRLAHHAPRTDRLPEERMDEALRERLRALGYLED